MADPVALFSDDADLGVIRIKAGRASFPNLIYAIYDGQGPDALVVDPGWGAELICDLLAARGRVLRGVLLTHSHRDHTAAAATLAELAQVPLYGSAACLATVEAPMARKNAIRETSELQIGAIRVQALMTPGHTSCSISYLVGGHLFPGDTLFIEGCGLATEPGGRAEELFATCQMLKRLIPDEVRVFPGHEYKRPVGASFAEVKASNLYLQINDQDNFTAFCNRPRRGRVPPTVGSVPEMQAEILDIHLPEPSFPFKEAI